MAVTTTKTNKPLNPRGNDQSPKGYNRAELYTGKALDFDGVNDDIRVSGFSISGDERSVVFCFKSTQNGNGRIFSIISGSNRFNGTLLNGNLNTYDGSNGINTDLDFNDSACSCDRIKPPNMRPGYRIYRLSNFILCPFRCYIDVGAFGGPLRT
jgi:hypothetical protein